MKTKFFILTVGVAMLGVSATAGTKNTRALTGNSMTEFGKYTITVSEEQMTANNELLPTYVVNYENGNEAIQIGLLKEEECLSFIVRSADFEIQYSCNKGVFGVKRIESRFQQMPKEEMDAKIDRVNYLAQRVICTNKKPQDELLGLIACYYPQLKSDNYQAGL